MKWNLAVRMLYCLVDFIKVYDARVNLGAVLKVKHMTPVFLRRLDLCVEWCQGVSACHSVLIFSSRHATVSERAM